MNDLKPFLEKILELEEPWFVEDITLDQEEARIDIYLDFKKGGTFPCPLCGAGNCKVHDTTQKTWRHLNLFQYKAYLHARVPRANCTALGPSMYPGPAKVAVSPCFSRLSPCPSSG